MDHRIMLFDLAAGGHHPSYIRHLINYWRNENLPVKLDIVVSPKFIDDHSDIVKIQIENDQSQIRFISITLEEYSGLISKQFLLKRYFKEWNLYCKYADELKAEHCLLMYLDTLQLPIVFGKNLLVSFLVFILDLHFITQILINTHFLGKISFDDGGKNCFYLEF